MGKAPAALLFIDEGLGWTWDLEDICGIPVFHGTGLTCSRWGTSTTDCPFVPIGRDAGQITYHDRRLFSEAWQ